MLPEDEMSLPRCRRHFTHWQDGCDECASCIDVLVARRREDPEFMERIERHKTKYAEVLRRLGDG